MGLFAMTAAPVSPPDVLGMGNGLEMPGIDAFADTTKVVELEPFGYRPDEELISHSMR
jgi:hypothetical protein